MSVRSMQRIREREAERNRKKRVEATARSRAAAAELDRQRNAAEQERQVEEFVRSSGSDTIVKPVVEGGKVTLVKEQTAQQTQIVRASTKSPSSESLTSTAQRTPYGAGGSWGEEPEEETTKPTSIRSGYNIINPIFRGTGVNVTDENRQQQWEEAKSKGTGLGISQRIKPTPEETKKAPVGATYALAALSFGFPLGLTGYVTRAVTGAKLGAAGFKKIGEETAPEEQERFIEDRETFAQAMRTGLAAESASIVGESKQYNIAGFSFQAPSLAGFGKGIVSEIPFTKAGGKYVAGETFEEESTFAEATRKFYQERGLTGAELEAAVEATKRQRFYADIGYGAGTLIGGASAEVLGTLKIGTSLALSPIKTTAKGSVKALAKRSAPYFFQAGFLEGTAVEAARQEGRYEDFNVSSITTQGIIGGLSATALGTTIFATRLKYPKISKGLNILANILDPTEAPSDFLGKGAMFGTRKIAGVSIPTPVIFTSAPVTDVTFGTKDKPPVPTPTPPQPSPVVSNIFVQQKNIFPDKPKIVIAPSLDPTISFQTPSEVVSGKSKSIISTPTPIPSITPVPTPTTIPTPIPIITPVPTPTPTPTTIPTPIPIITPVPTPTPTTIPTPVSLPITTAGAGGIFIPPPLPLTFPTGAGRGLFKTGQTKKYINELLAGEVLLSGLKMKPILPIKAKAKPKAKKKSKKKKKQAGLQLPKFTLKDILTGGF